MSPVESYDADAAVIWSTVQRLTTDGTYLAETSYGSYQGLFPPGTVFALTPFVLAFGNTSAAVLIYQLFLFLWGGLCIYFLLCKVADKGAARIGALLLAIIPNLVMFSPLPLQEPLVVALLASFMLLTVLAGEASERGKIILLNASAGIVFGFSVLVQPSLALFIFVIVIGQLFYFSRSNPFLRLSVIVLGILLTVAPWSIRQSLLFEKPVLLTTGAGWNFYVANSKHANGGFKPIEVVFPDHENFSEAEFSDEAFRRAFGYISANPVHFVELTIRRQLLQACCLDDGVRYSTRPWRQDENVVSYILIAFGCLSWLAIVTALLVRGPALAPNIQKHPELLFLYGLPLYTFVIHSFVEAGDRHQIMHFSSWIAILALAWAPINQLGNSDKNSTT